MQGGGQHYTTGSSISVSGVSTVAGLAYRPAGVALTLSVFFEAGWGSYNTRNSFANAPAVKGGGDTEYYGGGVLARYDFKGGVYVQGSVSVGNAKVNFKSREFISADGQSAGYDSLGVYYGAHAGMGYEFNLADDAVIDVYGRYLWTHMASDNVNMGGDPIRFNATNSQRLQLGARLDYLLMPGFIPYAGAAWDYEFGGRAKATTYGYSIDAPTIRGGSGMFEAGAVIQPDLDMPLFIEGGVQGYIGRREGLSGALKPALTFSI